MTIQSGFCNRNISVICPQFNIFTHFLFPFISALKEVKKMVNCLKISSVSPPFCKIFFEEGWKSMLSLPPFLTLWILMEFAGSSEENILIIKVRTKREKRPRTWGMGFESLTIQMCTWDDKPLRLVLRCWCLTSMNHEVVSGDGHETFLTMIEGSYFSRILLSCKLNFGSKCTLKLAAFAPYRVRPHLITCSPPHFSTPASRVRP